MAAIPPSDPRRWPRPPSNANSLRAARQIGMGQGEPARREELESFRAALSALMHRDCGGLDARPIEILLGLAVSRRETTAIPIPVPI